MVTTNGLFRYGATVLTFFVLLKHSESIVCYECSDVTLDGTCREDYKGLTEEYADYTLHQSNFTMNDIRESKYLKNCSSSLNYCVIQNTRNQDKYIQFLRGCSSADILPNLSFLHNVGSTPDNQSTCSLILPQGIEICTRLCLGDLCNGPQITVISASPDSSHITLITMAILYCVYCVSTSFTF